MGVGGHCHAPAAVPLGKNWYPLYKRLDGPQGWSGQVRKILPPPGFDPWSIQLVASRYTDFMCVCVCVCARACVRVYVYTSFPVFSIE